MDRRTLPSESFFAGTPPHVRAYIEQLHATIDDLHTRMREPIRITNLRREFVLGMAAANMDNQAL